VSLSFGNLNEVDFKTAYERMRAAFPVPCNEWICSLHAKEISEAFKADGTETTPLTWRKTEYLVKNWKQQCTPTEIYRKMGIYQ